MSTFDLTAYNAALKTLYSDQRVGQLRYEDNPLLALLPKDQKLFGKGLFSQPINYTPGAGASSTFATTLANQVVGSPVEFQIPRRKVYALGTVDNETLKASANDIGAFLDAASFVGDQVMRQAVDFLARSLYGSGTGTIGQVDGSVTSGVINLVDKTSAVHFEVGQVLEASTTDGGTARAAKGYVIAVDRDAGVVTVSATAGGSAGTPSDWADEDFLRVEGTRNVAILGLGSWLPTVAPTTGDAVFVTDRSVDPTKLAGVRFDGTGMSIDSALVRASHRIGREGGRPSHAFMSYETLSALVDSLGSKVQYTDLKGPANIGFKAVEIHGGNSTIKCIADRNCPPKRAYLLTLADWKLRSLGAMPEFDGGAAGMLLPDADAHQIRATGYGLLACEAPGHSGVVTLDA